jgi:hypothetical protein
VNPECVAAFNELKLGKGTVKYIIYKLADDYKEIVVETKSADKDWESFRKQLLDAKSGWKGKTGRGPRYAVYDFEYELEGGEGTRYGECTQWKEGETNMLIWIVETRLLSFLGHQMRELWST